MDILLIDNWDSFTYNLLHLCHAAWRAQFGQSATIKVVKNDAFALADVARWQPRCIVISPGPGTPQDAHMTLDVIQEFGGKIPIFGVCLGMQAMALCHGGEVVRTTPMHGKRDAITWKNRHPLFEKLQSPLTVTRYHSLHMLPNDALPIKVLATTNNNIVMALEIETEAAPMVGVQFHPESYGAPQGTQLLQNFFKLASPYFNNTSVLPSPPSIAIAGA